MARPPQPTSTSARTATITRGCRRRSIQVARAKMRFERRWGCVTRDDLKADHLRLPSTWPCERPRFSLSPEPRAAPKLELQVVPKLELRGAPRLELRAAPGPAPRNAPRCGWGTLPLRGCSRYSRWGAPLIRESAGRRRSFTPSGTSRWPARRTDRRDASS